MNIYKGIALKSPLVTLFDYISELSLFFPNQLFAMGLTVAHSIFKCTGQILIIRAALKRLLIGRCNKIIKMWQLLAQAQYFLYCI